MRTYILHIFVYIYTYVHILPTARLRDYSCQKSPKNSKRIRQAKDPMNFAFRIPFKGMFKIPRPENRQPSSTPRDGASQIGILQSIQHSQTVPSSHCRAWRRRGRIAKPCCCHCATQDDTVRSVRRIRLTSAWGKAAPTQAAARSSTVRRQNPESS